MSDGTRMEIQGLRALEARLTQLGGPAARRAVRRGLRGMGQVVREAVRERAPVDRGTLRRSVQIKDTGITPSGWSFAVQLRPAGFYGVFLEFGTSRMAARPFMRPAVESAAGRAGEAFRTATAAAVEQAWERR